MIQKTRPHICHVLTPSKFSGAELYALDVAEKLESDFDFTVITEPVEEVLYQAGARDVAAIPLKIEGKGNIFGYRRLQKRIRQIKPDIIHVHHTTGAFFGGLAGRKLGIPTVCTLHGYVPMFWQKYCDKYISISKDIYNYFDRWLSPDKHALVANGVDVSRFQPASAADKNRIRKEFNVPEKSFVIVQVSHLSRKKNPARLLEAMLHNPPREDIVFFVVGEGDLKESIEHLQGLLPDNIDVRVAGYQRDVLPYLQMADLFSQFSEREPFGYSVVEALASGLPVLSWETGSMIEIVKEGECGFLAKSNSREEIAGLLHHILDNRDWLQQAGRNAVHHVRKNYTQEIFLENLSKQYKAILKRQ